ncbi:hypothetical protein HK103_000178 [Boothiomyces macroporosus]|uniref:Uncharacterized protein n=1 Tax=Boothiomyces macroporosus TaxID=261099 RepID=A0AAD5UNE7_9FUNG|nr:hypothetical protein HK103_000178 [Boothiomyces macroporosus]
MGPANTSYLHSHDSDSPLSNICTDTSCTQYSEDDFEVLMTAKVSQFTNTGLYAEQIKGIENIRNYLNPKPVKKYSLEKQMFLNLMSKSDDDFLRRPKMKKRCSKKYRDSKVFNFQLPNENSESKFSKKEIERLTNAGVEVDVDPENRKLTVFL